MHLYGLNFHYFYSKIGFHQMIRTWPLSTHLTPMVTPVATPLVAAFVSAEPRGQWVWWTHTHISHQKHLFSVEKWNRQSSVDKGRSPCLHSICNISLSQRIFDSHWAQPALGLSGYDWTKKCASTTGSALSMLESYVSLRAICDQFNLHQQKHAWKFDNDVRLHSHNPSYSDQQSLSYSATILFIFCLSP